RSLSYYFLFQRYPDLRALHSFPTRRSSDLKSSTTETPKGEVKTENVSMRVLIPAFMISELKKAFEIGFMLMIPFLVIDVIVSALDRKSTRLNSSHVKISYAVFCLKKKKRNK